MAVRFAIDSAAEAIASYEIAKSVRNHPELTENVPGFLDQIPDEAELGDLLQELTNVLERYNEVIQGLVNRRKNVESIYKVAANAIKEEVAKRLETKPGENPGETPRVEP